MNRQNVIHKHNWLPSKQWACVINGIKNGEVSSKIEQTRLNTCSTKQIRHKTTPCLLVHVSRVHVQMNLSEFILKTSNVFFFSIKTSVMYCYSVVANPYLISTQDNNVSQLNDPTTLLNYALNIHGVTVFGTGIRPPGNKHIWLEK